MSERTIVRSGKEIRILPDSAALAEAAAGHFAAMAEKFVSEKGRFTAALSGGSTPRAMFSLLSAEPYLNTLPWRQIHLFQVDERCVPADHAESNYRMTRETLLAGVPLPADNFHRMPAEDPDPAHAAQLYSVMLQEFFSRGSDAEAVSEESPLPRFDLVFLGMGSDGHTASLFPGTEALQAGDQIAVANYVDKLAAWRITLTAAAINNARNVTFVIGGQDKASMLRRVIEGPHMPEEYPSQMIRPSEGSRLWLVDEAAAADLQAG